MFSFIQNSKVPKEVILNVPFTLKFNIYHFSLFEKKKIFHRLQVNNELFDVVYPSSRIYLIKILPFDIEMIDGINDKTLDSVKLIVEVGYEE